jgi:hypothetical protein
MFHDKNTFLNLADRDDFFVTGIEHNMTWGYIYGSGTYQLSGVVATDNFGVMEYALRSNRKGYIDWATMNIWEDDDFTQWHYKTDCETTVLIVSKQYVSFIFADLNNYFVSIYVSNRQVCTCINECQCVIVPHSPSALETLANMINFSILDN